MINLEIRRKQMLKKPTKIRRTFIKQASSVDNSESATDYIALKEQVESLTQQIKDNYESILCSAFSMDYYKSNTGFTYGEVYAKAGRDDRVVTFAFREDSDSYKK